MYVGAGDRMRTRVECIHVAHMHSNVSTLIRLEGALSRVGKLRRAQSMKWHILAR